MRRIDQLEHENDALHDELRIVRAQTAQHQHHLLLANAELAAQVKRLVGANVLCHQQLSFLQFKAQTEDLQRASLGTASPHTASQRYLTPEWTDEVAGVLRATVSVQRWVRALQLLKRSTVVLQSWWRCCCARALFARLRTEKNFDFSTRAAVLLQTVYRSAVCVRRYAFQRSVVLRLQAVFRWRQAFLRLEKLAAWLQRVVRGHLVRTRLRRWRETASTFKSFALRLCVSGVRKLVRRLAEAKKAKANAAARLKAEERKAAKLKADEAKEKAAAEKAARSEAEGRAARSAEAKSLKKQKQERRVKAEKLREETKQLAAARRTQVNVAKDLKAMNDEAIMHQQFLLDDEEDLVPDEKDTLMHKFIQEKVDVMSHDLSVAVRHRVDNPSGNIVVKTGHAACKGSWDFITTLIKMERDSAEFKLWCEAFWNLQWMMLQERAKHDQRAILAEIRKLPRTMYFKQYLLATVRSQTASIAFDFAETTEVAELFFEMFPDETQSIISLFIHVSASAHVECLEWFHWESALIQKCFLECALMPTMCKFLRRKKDLSEPLRERLVSCVRDTDTIRPTVIMEEAVKTLALLERPAVSFTEFAVFTLIVHQLDPDYEKLLLRSILLQLWTKENQEVKDVLKHNERIICLKFQAKYRTTVVKMLALVNSIEDVLFMFLRQEMPEYEGIMLECVLLKVSEKDNEHVRTVLKKNEKFLCMKFYANHGETMAKILSHL